MLAELEDNSRYKDVSKRDLVERVEKLEERIDRLETVFKDFRNKVMKEI